jgi:hypothetical protein
MWVLHVQIEYAQSVESVDCFHEEHVWDAFWLIYLGVRFAEIGTTRSVGDR